MVLAPLVGVVLSALGESGPGSAAADLLRYAGTTAILALGVGLVTAFLGSTAAWLVVMYRFPGREILTWGLALPLAMPAFAVAYGYADLLDVAGPLRTGLRAWIDVDLPFEIRSTGGAVFVMSAAFYPYVYLAMRAALLNLPGSALEAAAILGRPGLGALVPVILPLTRPALGAGAALAIMEALADYGAVQFLSVQTLTTGVIRAWFVFGSTIDAARLALPLLGAAALLLWLERAGRSGRTHEAGRTVWRAMRPIRLKGVAGAAAGGFCLLLVTAGLLAPAGWLGARLVHSNPDWVRLAQATGNSLTLSAAGAATTVILASLLALGGRRYPMASRLASLGYATPGAVMALGLLGPASIVWSLTSGGGLALALGLLVLAYSARLMAAALEPIDAGLARVKPSLTEASRTLGQGEIGTALRVSLPLTAGSLLTAGIIVFVDVLKELPATLILRPFNFDTLAVLASNYALDERLGQAGLPSLLILVLSLPAVIWLTRRIDRASPGMTP